MSLRIATAVLVAAAAAAAVTSAPAFACKGPTLIFSDNFQTADPAWNQQYGTLTISGGHAQLTAPAGDFANADYEGMFVDSGDACVDIVGPTVKDPSTVIGGIMFGFTDQGDFYAFVVQEDGQASIVRQQNGGWLNPVPMRAAPALKTGGNVTNTLRVTWKGTAGAAFINDQPFITFKIQPFQNGTFGIFSQPEGNIYQFSNMKVTNVP